MSRLLAPLFLMLGLCCHIPAMSAPPADALLRTLEEGDVARASGDYVALLQAAQMLQTLGAVPAEGQDDLAALWMMEAHRNGVVSALAYRGRALGPAYRRSSLAAGGRFNLRQLFLAGQSARISVAVAGGAPGLLSIRVRDGAGGTLCDKAVGAPQVDCAWLPLFTDRYAIELVNGGSAPVSFYLIIR